MRSLRGLMATLLFAAGSAFGQDAALAVHLLDYIAVDYSEAVADGHVKSADEYQEMTGFAANVAATVAKLPRVAGKDALDASARQLGERIAAKAPPAEVSGLAQQLRQAIVTAYQVSVGPRRAPSLDRGAALYAEHCAACHGAAGFGDGVAARGLDPAPSSFQDAARQRQRSAYGLFNTITRGVEGTAMRAFGDLPEADRWALAYVAANFGATGAERARGKAAWEKDPKLASQWTSHAAVAGRTPHEVAAAGGDEAVAVLAWLRANPALLDQGKPSPIDIARARLEESVALHAKGDADGAMRAALSAYLDGFELAEASLSTVNDGLMRRTEAAMIAYRAALQSNAKPDEVKALAKKAGELLEESREALGATLSPAATFFASFIILLREGLEAVLVVAALLAYLRRSDQAASLRHVHAGWIAALALGALTWYVATAVVSIGGAHREAAEGLTGLAAAAMVIYMGFWLHDKAHAEAWQKYLMRGAKSARAAWGLALIAFLAVYREVFETVLFYQALWLQAPGQEVALAGGVAAGAIALAAITVAMLRYSVRMPLGLFFGAGGILLAVIGVVLAGNGVAALQEAGWLPVTPVAFMTVSWLGIHPNLQSLGTQAVLAVLVAFLLRAPTRKAGVP